VLWGRCYEEEGVPPYWPWVQAIRSYVREKHPEELGSEMGAGAENIAEIVSGKPNVILASTSVMRPEAAVGVSVGTASCAAGI